MGNGKRMGVDKTARRAIIKAIGLLTQRKTALTLGRQLLHLGPEYLDDLWISQNVFETVDSVDCSPYEGASIIHNMNTAIDSTFKKYDFIYDGGFTEHIFNVPQVLENVIDFLEVGGVFCSVTPNNNASGHGFYQFSPELFLSCFTKTYGMEILHMWIAIACSEDINSWIDVYNNKYTEGNRTTQKFNSSECIYIVVIARKVSDDRESLIENPPNQFSYEQVDWKKSGPI
jgi:hypothetical protein